MTSSILLSIKPKYVDLIVSQKKTIEIRKKVGKYFSIDSWVYIYASSPNMSIIGKFQIADIVPFKINDVHQVTLEKSCLSYDEMESYLDGKIGMAIHIKNVTLFNPLHLKRVKIAIPSFRPPQSFYYMPDNLFDLINEYQPNDK